MKKDFFIFLMVICFILGACSGETAESSVSQSELSSQAIKHSSSESIDEPYSYYPIFEKMEAICLGDGYEEASVFMLNDERSKIW